MRVKSKLADVDFRFGQVRREGAALVISSHPSQTMQSKVYVTPDDVLQFLGRLLASPSALAFVIAFPWFWWRSRSEAAPRHGRTPRDPW